MAGTKEPYITSDQKTIYEKAFADYYRRIWFNYENIGKSVAEIKDLCYHRALSTFYYESDEDYQDRQILLYQYMGVDYTTHDKNSLLNIQFNALPNQSDIKTILQEICTAYDDAPQRQFYKNNTVWETRFKENYQEANINSIFQDVYELGKMLGVVAVAPMFVEGKMRAMILTPDQFRIWTDASNKWKVVKIVYPDIYQNQIVYHEWTPETYTIKDKDGYSIDMPTETTRLDNTNIYGEIPFVFLRLTHGRGYLTGGMLSALYTQLKINKARKAAENIMTYSGFPIMLGTNIDVSRISPNKILGAKELIRDVDVIPSFEFVEPSPMYNDISEYIDNELLRLKETYGIPTDPAANSSGIARVIARQRIIETRKKDIQGLARFEKEFADKVKLIMNKDGIYKQEAPELEFAINYADERLYEEPSVERAEDKARMQEGLMSIEEYYTKWGAFDTNQSQVDVLEIVKQRKKELDLLEEAEGKTNTMPNNEEVQNAV